MILKWFIEEDDSQQALWLRRAYKSRRISVATTDLAFYEVANVLRYSNLVSSSQEHTAIQTLRGDIIHVISFDENVLHNAIEIAEEANISIYDAYFVAQADLEGLRFITADKKLARAVRGLTDVMTLEEYAARLN